MDYYNNLKPIIMIKFIEIYKALKEEQMLTQATLSIALSISINKCPKCGKRH